MSEVYNIYCDESCHLERSNSPSMVIGAVYCKKNEYKTFVDRIFEIKKRYNISRFREIKWTKISPAQLNYYRDIVEFFFKNEGLFFRALVIPNKNILDHKANQQTHEEWYWKMYYDMLKVIFQRDVTYNIFIDIKDTHSVLRSNNLKKILQHTKYEFDGNVIKNVQIVRSHEVALMQLTDIFIGALTFVHRGGMESESTSSAKKDIVSLIKSKSRCSLKKTTYLSEKKFNIFIWDPSRKEL